MGDAGHHVVRLHERDRMDSCDGMDMSFISSIHIEPSSRCTLLCPQCPRTENLDMISSEDCDIDSMVKACHDYQEVLMCGNHGDPIYHREFHRLIRKLKEDRADRNIRIITNGAFRSREWWDGLARLLTHEDDSITFSIDGMPDNNHLYRVNSKWSTIEDGIVALRNANPALILLWKWILFRYNEGQIHNGITYAKELGFKKFILVKSVRYEEGDTLTPTRSYDKIKEETLRWHQSHHAVR